MSLLSLVAPIQNYFKGYVSSGADIVPAADTEDGNPIAQTSVSADELSYSSGHTSTGGFSLWGALNKPSLSSAGCGGPSGNNIVDTLKDGGIIPQQTDAHVGDDAYVILPQNDAGQPILPGEVFETIDATGAGFEFLQGTRMIELSTGVFGGSGLQNQQLYAEIGTDSRCIPNMPQDANLGCFSGLINVTPSMPEHGLVCYDTVDASGFPVPVPEYADFAFCPDQAEWQVQAYYAELEIKCGGQTVFAETTPAENILDGTAGRTLNTVCGPEAEPFTQDLPNLCNSSGQADVTFTLRLLADARDMQTQNMVYKTCMYFRVKAQEAN